MFESETPHITITAIVTVTVTVHVHHHNHATAHHATRATRHDEHTRVASLSAATATPGALRWWWLAVGGWFCALCRGC